MEKNTTSIGQLFANAMAEEGMGRTVTPGEGLVKLVGEKASPGKVRAGDFVHQGQTMAKGDGFKNVSKIWYDKTISYEDGLEDLAKGKAATEDIMATIDEMKPCVIKGKFAVAYKDGRMFRPTTYAIEQMGGWSNCSKWYVEQLLNNPTDKKGNVLFERDEQDAQTLLRVLDNGFRRLKEGKTFLFRTRQDGTLRAMLSEEYAIINNQWFIEVLRELIPGGRLSHWRGDSDTLFGNILIPDQIRQESDSDYGGMLSVGNSEIGERRVSSLPSIFRAICMNGCIWGQKAGKGIKQVHRGEIDLMELRAAIQANLEIQIPLLPAGIDRLLKTREHKWTGDSIKPLFAQVAKDFTLTKRQATSLLDAYNVERAATPEYARTLFSVVNAVTRAGQGLDNSIWVRFDEIGGELSGFGADEWSRLVGRAKSLKATEVDGVFAAMAV